MVFDGWTEGTHHYIGLGIAASYIKVVDGKETACQALLSMQPLLADGIKGMRAVDHIEHLLKVLLSYGKSCANIICFVGDNCSVNQSMARLLNVALLGCASHKFNLAVRRWIAEQPELIPIIAKVSACCAIVLFIHCCSNNSFACLMTKQVSRLMKKACTLKIASQLSDLTDYAAVRDNDTRWSSTYNMLKRFLNIKTELSAIVELLTLFPNHLEVDILSRACETMKKFDSVTIML